MISVESAQKFLVGFKVAAAKGALLPGLPARPTALHRGCAKGAVKKFAKRKVAHNVERPVAADALAPDRLHTTRRVSCTIEQIALTDHQCCSMHCVRFALL